VGALKEIPLCPVFVVGDGEPEEVRSARVLLGRGPACHVRLEHENVSVLHAEVVLTNKGYLLRDLASTNGVYVQGKRVKQVALRPGDRFRLGREGPTVLFCPKPLPCGYVPKPVERYRKARGWMVLGLGMLLVSSVLTVRIFHFQRRQRALNAIFVLAEDKGERIVPLGSAFLVHEKGWLLTNAHVAHVLRKEGARGVAVPNAAPGQRHPILDILIHPEHRTGEFGRDVALVRIDPAGGDPSPISWARRPLRQGQRIYCLGYPFNAVHPSHPTASLLEGVVSRVEGNTFFQHDVVVSPGLSGSPLFDERFYCVGVVVGGDMTSLEQGGSNGTVGWALAGKALRAMLVPPFDKAVWDDYTIH